MSSVGLVFTTRPPPPSPFTIVVAETLSSTELRQPSLAQINQISTVDLISWCSLSGPPLLLVSTFLLTGTWQLVLVVYLFIPSSCKCPWVNLILPSFALRFGPLSLVVCLSRDLLSTLEFLDTCCHIPSHKIDFFYPQSLVRAPVWSQCLELAATVSRGEVSGDGR